MSGYKYEAVYSSVGNVLLWEENLVKLLGVLIVSGLNINSYMQGICKKASQNIHFILLITLDVL